MRIFAFAIALTALLATILVACSADDEPARTKKSSSKKDSKPDDDVSGDDDESGDDSGGDDANAAKGDAGDSECAKDEVVAGTTPDDTCAAFGEGEPCDSTCGRSFGYVCGVAPPPGVAHCKLSRSSAVGATYCCAELACVRVPSLDASCKDTAKPKIFQCPTGGEAKTLLVQPAAGCVETKDAPIPDYRYFCCPAE